MTVTEEGRAVQFGIWLQPTASSETVAEWARIAEDEGFDFVGITDGQNIWRDVYVCLTAAALATRRIRLGTWVTNPFTRHVTVTANALCTLDEVSGGRAFLGIGIGDDSVRTIGHRVAKMGELAEVVGLIRRLVRGERVETPTGTWHLATARGDRDIYWAAANPLSLEYAGRHADGAIVSGWLVPDLLTRAREAIATGVRAAGRAPGSVATIFNSCFSVNEDGACARAASRPYVARALCYTSSAQLPDWSSEDMERFRAQYDYYDHFAPGQGLASLVPEHLITRKAVAGTPEECARLLQIVVDSGFDRVALIPMGEVVPNIRLLGSHVLPRLRLPMSV